jgi:glycosyltransferase involved in cell wall biosynthesis
MSLVAPEIKCTLTIIGDGQQRRLLSKWVKDLRLEGRVTWRGRIPWSDVLESYDNADLFLFTSLRDTEGAQLLEAMGRGLPILTLDHHGAAMLVTDKVGVKIPVSTAASTAERLSRAIEQLAVDRERLFEMGEAAIHAAHGYTWERKALEMVGIYDSLTCNASRVLRLAANKASSRPTTHHRSRAD